MSSKWAYKKKMNPDGSPRYKVRLVIRGFEQVKGMDYRETYAPVSKLSTSRLLICLAAKNAWTVDHMDVMSAFLNPKIDRANVDMKLPPEMEWIDPRLRKCGVNIVRLRKALYGLRQAPRLWYEDVNSFLISLGFQPSTADPNLYTSDFGFIVLLYLDDILIIDTNPSLSNSRKIKEQLLARYRMTDLGPAQRFLGIKIERGPNEITLSQ
jgi:hypothetical protein